MSKHCSQLRGSATSELSSTVSPSLSSSSSSCGGGGGGGGGGGVTGGALALALALALLLPKEQFFSDSAIISMLGAVIERVREERSLGRREWE